MQKWGFTDNHYWSTTGVDRFVSVNLLSRTVCFTQELIFNFVSFEVDAALAYDSINVAVNAITKLLNEHSGLFNHTFKRDTMWNHGYPGVYCHPAEDKMNPNRPFFPMENGELLAKSLRNVTLSFVYVLNTPSLRILYCRL